MTEFHEFSTILMPQLLADGYRPINFNQLDAAAPPVMILYKQEGAVFYVVNLYRLTEDPVHQFHDLREATVDKLRQMGERADIRYMISYNILIARAAHEELLAFVTNSEAYFSQSFYEINYAVTTDDGKLFFAKNQPQEITRIKQILLGALTSKDQDAPETIANITEASDQLSQIKPQTKRAYLTYAIIAVNALLLLLMEFSGGSEDIETLLNFGAMNYLMFLEGDYYRVFTAMFLHIGIMHFLYNSLSLHIFGARVERHYGRIAFIAIYLFSGLFGNLLNAMFAERTVLAGASAGIFGLLGAAIAITQVSRKSIDGLNFYTMMIFVISGVLFGFMMPNIGNIAHIGGLIAGYLTGFIILKIQGAGRHGGNTGSA